MTSGVPQQSAVALRIARLVERAIAFAIEERDDNLAVARLAWLAQDDQAALDQAGQVSLEHTETDLSSAPGRPGCWAGSATTSLPLDPLAAAGLVRPSSRARPEPPTVWGQPRPGAGADRRPCRTR
jgi:hypothetical protein